MPSRSCWAAAAADLHIPNLAAGFRIQCVNHGVRRLHIQHAPFLRDVSYVVDRSVELDLRRPGCGHAVALGRRLGDQDILVGVQ